jgi:hypothetical protein
MLITNKCPGQINWLLNETKIDDYCLLSKPIRQKGVEVRSEERCQFLSR